MTNEQAISVLNMVEAHGSLVIEAKQMAIQALERQKKIKEIIDISNMVIQEDVLKYKMICEVMEE